jgi:serine/threonine protein kinase
MNMASDISISNRGTSFRRGTTSSSPTSARPPPLKLGKLPAPRVRRVLHICTLPEVTAKLSGMRQRHGRASDIFALGCVFCDMMTVLTGPTVSCFHDFLLSGIIDTEKSETMHKHDREPLYYSHKTKMIQQWFSASEFHHNILVWMLASDRNSRPSAPTLLHALTTLDQDGHCEYSDIVILDEQEVESVENNSGPSGLKALVLAQLSTSSP